MKTYKLINKIFFLLCFVKYIRMVVITVQAYEEAGVHTIKVGNKRLFWVKMIDVLKRLVMPD